MIQKVIANRTAELALFQQMLAKRNPAKILLIKAPSGMGKSWLLRKFRECCPPPACVISLNLRGADLGVSYVLNWICEDLGYANFPRFQEDLQRMMSGSINFSNNTLEGEQNILIALNVDETQRKYRLSSLQSSFFKDLATLDHPVILLIDTFDSAVKELQNWIESELLRRAVRLPNLTVVVAGQEVPNPENIDWGNQCEYHRLEPIDDEEAWFAFAQKNYPNFEKPAVKAFVKVLNGHPLQIHQTLQNLAKGW